MKKNITRIITLIFITQVLLSSAFLIRSSYGTPIETDVGFGTAPIIDGAIDGTINEWSSAEKLSISLFQNQSNGLPIDLWILQADLSLNILVRFDFNNHSSSEYDNEFIGILIADYDDSLNFTDAKIVQFSNISENTLEYLDYYINDTIYYEDTSSDGEGTASLENNKVIYEFSMPVKNVEEGIEDVELDYGRDFDFKIVFGNPEEYPAEYPADIKISNIVSIYLEYPPGGPGEDIGEILMSISTYIIFITIGALYVFYIYRITQLKKEIERIRS